uniref:Uncharacterized protein n=2 Tax=Ixodes scapularis TaxID=6945 RepID=A0A1S4LYK9_IXOSC
CRAPSTPPPPSPLPLSTPVPTAPADVARCRSKSANPESIIHSSRTATASRSASHRTHGLRQPESSKRASPSFLSSLLSFGKEPSGRRGGGGGKGGKYPTASRPSLDGARSW